MWLTDLSKDFCFIPLDLIIVKLKAYALHKKWSFPLRISSVNVTKSQETADLVTFTEEILDGKVHFLCNYGFHVDASQLIHDLNKDLK